jgi:predicted NBD/HSP70 family sugar kinase
VARAVELGVLEAGTPLGSPDMVERAFSRLAVLAATGSPTAHEMISELVERMAIGIISVVNLLDLQRVVMGGPYWGLVSALALPLVSEAVNRAPSLISRDGVAVTDSRVGEDVAAVGAACLVLDNILSPRPSALLISS